MIFTKLEKRFSPNLETRYVELYSPESFENAKVIEMLKKDSLKPPFIFINDEIIDSGGKLSERKIKESVEHILNK